MKLRSESRSVLCVAPPSLSRDRRIKVKRSSIAFTLAFQVSSQQRHISKFHNSASQFDNFLPALGAEVVAEELLLLEAES